VTNKFNILLVLILTFLSCENKCEIVTDFHKNGFAKTVVYYPDCNNKTTYRLLNYYKNGKVRSEGFVKNNEKDGIFKKWSKDGILIEKFEIQNNKRDGITECWFENGAKKSETYYENGLKQGKYKAWYSNRKLMLEGKFDADERTGEWNIYSNEGNWKKDNYRNGKLNGFSFEYIVEEKDTSYIVGQYKNGKESGLWKWFDNDSLLTESLLYKNGSGNGEHILYHKNGRIKSKGIILNEKPDGIFNMYDSNGVRIKKMVFENGILKNEENYR
jgi:antitoxin component YwqK of YwqJK toxin-antitoxin module